MQIIQFSDPIPLENPIKLSSTPFHLPSLTFSTPQNNLKETLLEKLVFFPLKPEKNSSILNKIDDSISHFTSKSNNSLKNSMKIIDKLENKGLQLNPLMYLSSTEQSLLEEITKQYQKMIQENNQSRGFFI